MCRGPCRSHAWDITCTFPEKNQEQIAAHVGCTQSRVNDIKKQLIDADKLKLPEKRVGRDGKSYKTTYAPRKAKATPEEVPEPPRIRSADEILAGVVEPKAGPRTASSGLPSLPLPTTA